MKDENLGLVNNNLIILLPEPESAKVQRIRANKFIKILKGFPIFFSKIDLKSFIFFRNYDGVFLNADSAAAARLAAGSCLELVTRLLAGDIGNGLGLVRPPGHHSGPGHISGW